MKRCLLLLYILGTACCAFCQTTDSAARLQRTYKRRSQLENTAGIVLLSGGTGMMIYGLAASLGNAFGNGVRDVFGVPRQRSKGPVTLTAIGGAAALASLPMFVLAGNDHRRAKQLSFGMQTTQALLPAGRIGCVAQPSLTLRFAIAGRGR